MGLEHFRANSSDRNPQPIRTKGKFNGLIFVALFLLVTTTSCHSLGQESTWKCQNCSSLNDHFRVATERSVLSLKVLILSGYNSCASWDAYITWNFLTSVTRICNPGILLHFHGLCYRWGCVNRISQSWANWICKLWWMFTALLLFTLIFSPRYVWLTWLLWSIFLFLGRSILITPWAWNTIFYLTLCSPPLISSVLWPTETPHDSSLFPCAVWRLRPCSHVSFL